MSAPIRELDVLWRVPGHRRYHVGVLAREDDRTYRFEYAPAAQLLDAEQHGFAGIAGLPRGGGEPIRARHLFATFAQRIPSPKRPDFDRLMAEWGVVDSTDKFEILARSGGLLLTDHLELCEHRSSDDDLAVPLSFVVAGMKYHRDSDANRAAVGDKVSLRHEPANPADPHAVAVVWDGERIGHAPRQYAALLASLLDAGTPLQAVIERKLLVPHEGPRWVVRTWNGALNRVA